ncbi:MAG: flagellar motor switch protein FliM [Bdellovibrionaceae bacterium]|nr:flagellar motor switch protein FliM [Pseudobdellovibrionaceae bacterium]|tara:strand:- start:29653 stop:30654 length:1002 start_codon:yes stop_codon:yes gene_type:complete
MNQVLSQSEVDALLAAVSEGEIDTGEDAAGGGGGGGGDDDRVVVSYDLTSQDRIIRGRLPQLDVIYEKFMRSFRVSLSSALRKIATLNHASTDFLKFGEFINTLPMPTCMSVLRFNSLRGSALFVIESKLAYALVDNFFGGADHPYTKIEGKDFTPIELQIVRKVVDLAIVDLDAAWSSVEKIDCSFVRTEVNPQFVGIVPPTDIVIASTFDVELENANGTITLVVPYSTIEPIKQKLSTGFQVESDQTDKKLWTSIIKEQLVETNVNLKVDLGTTEISVDDLMKLKVGDVIPLDQDATGEFDVQVEGVKKYKAYYGIHHGTVAVQVTRPVEK